MSKPLNAQVPPDDAIMSGYLLVPNERVPNEFNAGFSLYVSAWPLLEHYPGREFQTGLFGTWMFPLYDPPVNRPLQEGVYTDIEGGLGWWRDTRFATETPKFIMGGVDLNFRRWANGPGAGKGRKWDEPNGKYGVAQLSPRILWPPDGLNLKQGTQGELFGYGYLPLPLTDPQVIEQEEDNAKKEDIAQENLAQEDEVQVGNQCWTLFLNTENFKGPVAFFTPAFWSQVYAERPELQGKLLDAAAVNPNRALQMETQYVPARIATDKNGEQYARIASVRFPLNELGQSKVVHRITSYQRAAKWDDVSNWFQGGEIAETEVNAESRVVHAFPGDGGATWRIYPRGASNDQKHPIQWTEIANPDAFDDATFGYEWTSTSEGAIHELPQYFRFDTDTQTWLAVTEDAVPKETGLLDVVFPRFERPATDAYETPTDSESCWKTPGPVAGPFEAYPGDGSVVTYYWYRFADQPALLNANLSVSAREELQRRAELLHRFWTKDREYLEPPEFGDLAEIDPALIVEPPEGLEIGYVPIVTKQAQAKRE